MHRSFTIRIDLNWRTLLGFAVLVATIAAIYLVAGAQEGTPPNTNDPGALPPQSPAQDVPASAPDAGPPPQDGMLASTNGEWVWPDQVGQTEVGAAGVAGTAAGSSGRHVYLSTVNHFSDRAATACAPGYHLASLWEILDVSTLTYDRDHPAAYSKADSGQGPPSNWYGWVRTGYDSSTSATTGTGNCANWSTRSNTAYGVSVRLSPAWESAPGDIYTWDATSFACNTIGPVWCVRD